MNRLWMRLGLVIVMVIIVTISPLIGAFALAASGVYDFEEPAEASEKPHSSEEWFARTLGLVALTSLVGLIAGIVASQQVVRPIQQLGKAVAYIGQGHLGHQVQLKRASTELTALSEAINRMSTALEQGETMRRRLMADVSHELRTPLTILQGHLRAALDDVYDLSEEEIAKLYQQTHHLVQLVDDLHLLAKAEADTLPLDMRPTNIQPLVEEVVDNYRLVAAENNVTLTASSATDNAVIEVDAMRLRQILTNLIENALRHTPPNGRIQLQISHINDQMCISVGDSGEGIAEMHLPHIFERFYRTDTARDRPTGGSGLGLAIVKALVEVQGGQISVESQLGTGTIFHMTLPLRQNRI